MDSLKNDTKKTALLVEDIVRPPLVPSEKHNAVLGKDVATRYNTDLAAATKTRRCASPSLGKTSATDGTPKRAQSADRRRPSTPSTPSSRVLRPSTPPSRSATPVHDTATELPKSSKRIAKTRGPDVLWPTVRNLSSSLQTKSVAADKKDKVDSGSSLDHSKGEVSALTVRNRSPFRRKNVGEQCENDRPSEDPPKRVTERHRWPAMIGGLMPTNLMPRSIDSSDRASRPIPLSNTSRGLSPRKMLACEGKVKGSNQSLDEVARRLSIQERRRDDKVDSSSNANSQTTERSKSVSRPNRTVTFPVPVLHHPSSPNKVLSASSSTSRSFQNPSRIRHSTPCQSQSTGTMQSGATSPIINYMVNAKKGKKNASQIENIHQLRLLYNRYLQWLIVNARAEDILSFQTIVVENTIYNVWRNTLNLRDSVNMRRIMVQHLQQEIRLYDILKEQIAYLEQWPALERENNIALFGATEALKASTLRLPLTSGARADAITLKNAISSAVDVMQGLGSSVFCMYSKVVDRASLVSELSVTTTQEKLTLDECRELLAISAKLQVLESSLRTHLMQQRNKKF